VQNLFHSVQLNVNNPHFLIMQGRITKARAPAAAPRAPSPRPHLCSLRAGRRRRQPHAGAGATWRLQLCAVLAPRRPQPRARPAARSRRRAHAAAQVLNMKPPEILGMLEEAAGTRMYEMKKDAALRTLEKKQVKVEEINALAPAAQPARAR